MQYVLEACKDAARQFGNDVASFRVPRHLDYGPILHQLKAGGFRVDCGFGGLLKVGWEFDPDRELTERRQNEQDTTNIKKLEELDAYIRKVVEPMGLTHTTVRIHPYVPRSAIACLSWL